MISELQGISSETDMSRPPGAKQYLDGRLGPGVLVEAEVLEGGEEEDGDDGPQLEGDLAVPHGGLVPAFAPGSRELAAVLFFEFQKCVQLVANQGSIVAILGAFAQRPSAPLV